MRSSIFVLVVTGTSFHSCAATFASLLPSFLFSLEGNADDQESNLNATEVMSLSGHAITGRAHEKVHQADTNIMHDFGVFHPTGPPRTEVVVIVCTCGVCR